MKTTLMIVAISAAFPISEGILSYFEGTFSRVRGKKLKMSFLWNWAISIGDLFILTLINTLVVPELLLKSSLVLTVNCLVLGFIVSVAFHSSWWGKKENIGHVFSKFTLGAKGAFVWMKDLTLAGWVHFIYMGLEVGIFALVLITPIKITIIIMIGALFGNFLAIQNAQAAVVQGVAQEKACRAYAWQASSLAAVLILKSFFFN